jgi:outer membrane lipoprotein-sorting protein
MLIDAEPTGRIRSILIEDVQGNRTRFRFESVRENTGLADRLFRFDDPAGVEVSRG